MKKNFQVRERIPQLGVGQRRQVNRKLHPAHLLKLEAAVRAAKEAATTASTSWFVPVPYRLLRRPNPAFHRALATCPPAARRAPRIQNNSGLSQGPAHLDLAGWTRS